MERKKYTLEPTVLSSLLNMYTKCNEPELVQSIWDNIAKSNGTSPSQTKKKWGGGKKKRNKEKKEWRWGKEKWKINNRKIALLL